MFIEYIHKRDKIRYKDTDLNIKQINIPEHINIPPEIINKIILDSIILLKNENGWREVNARIKKPLRLRYVGYIYEPELKYYCIYRRYAEQEVYDPFIII